MHVEQQDRALATDLYELTMAAAYFRLGITQRAAFELFVRELPEPRSFLLCAGLEQAACYLQELAFSGPQIDYLRCLPVFEHTPGAFFDYLAGLRFSGTVLAMPEGTPAFAGEPLLRVEGPIIEAQIVETFLLSMINYQTLVASKAARIVAAAGQDGRERAVVDFGTRRAHGPDAGVLAARASFIGGCVGTSNVEAGFRMGIPVSGTEAHSFVMAFDREQDAFQGYYECFGEHAVLLIDTYDVLEGARRAAAAAPKMRGVRLDSGDIAALSKQVRKLLDEAGRKEALIFATGDLDEYRIAELIAAGAEVDGFGVGTRLVTSQDAPSLGGVYKLVAIERDGRWEGRLKLSEDKATYPGPKQVYRFSNGEGLTHDLLAGADEARPPGAEPLLSTVIKDGRLLHDLPQLSRIRERAREQLGRLPARHRRLRNAEPYPVRVSDRLRQRFESLARRAKGE